MPAERVTTQHPADGEPAPAHRSEALERLGGVRRAGRREAAGRRRQRGDGPLVESDRSDEECLEQRSSVTSINSVRSWRKVVSYASRRARTSTSSATPAFRSRGSTSIRPNSRSRRFNLFRRTIVRPCLGTIRPNRQREAGEAAKKTSRCDVLLRFPRLSSPRISSVRRIRSPGGSPYPIGPGRSAPTAADLLRADRDHQAAASSPPAPRQRLPTTLGAHTGTESVLVLPLAVARPVGRLHALSPIRRSSSGTRAGGVLRPMRS